MCLQRPHTDNCCLWGEFKHEVAIIPLGLRALVVGLVSLVLLYGFVMVTVIVMVACVPFEIILLIGNWIWPDPETPKQVDSHAERS